MSESGQAINDLRIVRSFPPGCSTATPLNLRYRLGKIASAGRLTGRWLDYGCAEGDYTFGLVGNGAECAVGFDVIEERVDAARQKFANEPRVRFLHSPSGIVDAPDNYFDGVFVNEVMEHVSDEAAALTEINRVLRPGGYLYVVSPNRYFPFECHGARIGGIELHFPVPVLPWLPKLIGQRFMCARNYWPSELGGLVARFGFRVEPLQFVWPVLEKYPWLPPSLIRLYQGSIERLDGAPVIRRFGVSTLVVGRKERTISPSAV